MTPADSLLDKLDGVRKAGNGRWRARCPACGGKNATKLSIAEGDDGRVLLRCWAGCTVDQIVTAVGMRLEDLFPPKSPGDVPRVRKPWTAREVAQALEREAGIAWIVLSDLAAGRPIGKSDRERAGVAAERCAALLRELAG